MTFVTVAVNEFVVLETRVRYETSWLLVPVTIFPTLARGLFAQGTEGSDDKSEHAGHRSRPVRIDDLPKP